MYFGYYKLKELQLNEQNNKNKHNNCIIEKLREHEDNLQTKNNRNNNSSSNESNRSNESGKSNESNES